MHACARQAALSALELRADAASSMALRCPRRPSSISTSTRSTRSWTGRAGSRRSRRGPPSSRCPPSRSPITARSPARSSSIGRRGSTGVKPIVGCEVYVADDRRPQEKGYAHLTLLAETNEGYANLIKLSSLGYLEGYYYKPRVDWELLERHSTGLVALSGCLSGRVSKALEESRPQDAAADLDRLVQIFGRDRPTSRSRTPARAPGADQPAAREARGGDRAAARRHGRRPLPPARGRARARGAALHPVRRLAEEPEPLAVRHRPVLLQDARRDGRRLRRPTRRRCAARSRSPSAARSTIELGRHAAAVVPDARRPRRLRLPRRAVRGGLARRYESVTPELRERLQFELKTIREMGFADYFLIVWDFVHFAKTHGISVGPGAARPPDRWPRTASRSPTSTRSATACSSSASSTRAASRCPTWTSTSPSRAASA